MVVNLYGVIKTVNPRICDCDSWSFYLQPSSIQSQSLKLQSGGTLTEWSIGSQKFAPYEVVGIWTTYTVNHTFYKTVSRPVQFPMDEFRGMQYTDLKWPRVR